MSMSYKKLRARAIKFIPDVPIKEGNTWIAILIHSISRVEDITEKNEILWIKCHGRITIRTIKHEYFSRHPLEDFQLKFIDIFPADSTQVKDLRAYQRKHHHLNHHVLVLRAFEDRDVDGEMDLDDDAKEAEEIRKLAARGPNGEFVIIVEDDDDDDDDNNNNNHNNNHLDEETNGEVQHSHQSPSSSPKTRKENEEEQSSTQNGHRQNGEALPDVETGQHSNIEGLVSVENHSRRSGAPSSSHASHSDKESENIQDNSVEVNAKSPLWEPQNEFEARMNAEQVSRDNTGAEKGYNNANFDEVMTDADSDNCRDEACRASEGRTCTTVGEVQQASDIEEPIRSIEQGSLYSHQSTQGDDFVRSNSPGSSAHLESTASDANDSIDCSTPPVRASINLLESQLGDSQNTDVNSSRNDEENEAKSASNSGSMEITNGEKRSGGNDDTDGSESVKSSDSASCESSDTIAGEETDGEYMEED